MIKIQSHIFAGAILALGFSVCGHNGSDLLFDKKKTTGAEENTGGDSVSVSTIPANGATSVLTSTTITVTFSTAMNNTTVTTNTADTVCSGSLQVSADNFTTCVRMNSPISSSGGDTVFTMTPMTALTGGPTNYKIRVTTAAQSVASTTLSSAFVNTFTTQDLIDPSVSNVTPGGGSTGVATGTAVTATFSEAMSAGTLTVDTNTTCSGSFQLYITPGTCVPMNASVGVSGGNTLFTFTPQAALTTSTTYTVKITTATQDASGRGISANYTTSFTTGAGADVTAPTVSSTTPANSATNIAIGTTISVAFNEAMNASTVTTSTSTTCSGGIQVSKQSDNFAAGTCIPMNSSTAVASGGNTVFTATPSANLAGNTTYIIKITSPAADVAGNTVSTVTKSFTTIASPIYLFASTSAITANLGGRSGADSTCTASKPGALTCSGIRAVVSITGTDEITDMASNYTIPAGRPVQGPGGSAFQTDWATFVTNGATAANAAETAGILPTSSKWWSFGAPTIHAQQHCQNGTVTTGGGGGNKGRAGDSTQSGALFLDSSPIDCGSTAYLLCVCY